MTVSTLLPLLVTLGSHTGVIDELKALTDAKSDAPTITARIEKALKDDELLSGNDFLSASTFAPIGTERLPEMRLQYELALTAVCSGEKRALPRLIETWDTLFDSVSRPRRMHAPAYKGGRERFQPTAQVIRQVWDGKSDSSATPNPRIEKMFDEDQVARQADFSKFTQKDIENMVKGDTARLAEAKAIVAKGKVSTSEDFERLAFIFQHSSNFEDYATAHELAICAVLRGNKSATWIAGASYDRMMLSASYPQRFGTQFRMADGKVSFDLIDKSLMNDRQRKIVIRKTLEEAMKIFDK